MIEDRDVLAVQRLIDDLARLGGDLRSQYRNRTSQVRSEALTRRAADLAETWMVEVAAREDFKRVLDPDYLANLTVLFQRILTISGLRARRSEYDVEIRGILRDSRQSLIIPLKQARGREIAMGSDRTEGGGDDFIPTAFVAQSFAPVDEVVNTLVRRSLEALGISVLTGERPKADRISEKVRQRIERQFLFVGVFTRRDQLAAKTEWTTSAWLIDEKAYAVAMGKKLILLREEGVSTIGGIQGDYEYFMFSRDRLHELGLYLTQLFVVTIAGLAS